MNRRVYLDIEEQYRVFLSSFGDYYLVHKEDISGKPRKDYIYDQKVHRGEMHIKMTPQDPAELAHFPWYQMNHGRTEDVIFFERAKRAGHQLWLDTSLEAGHQSQVAITGETRRNYIKATKMIEDRHPRPYEVEQYVPTNRS